MSARVSMFAIIAVVVGCGGSAPSPRDPASPDAQSGDRGDGSGGDGSGGDGSGGDGSGGDGSGGDGSATSSAGASPPITSVVPTATHHRQSETVEIRHVEPLDADEDGIPYPTDLCPHDPEDVDGDRDDDGCPDRSVDDAQVADP